MRGPGPSAPECWNGEFWAYRREAEWVDIWENGELGSGWEPSVFCLEFPCRRLKLGQKTMALRLKESFLALDVALAVFDKQGFLLFSEEGLLGSLREREKVEAIRLPLKRF